MLSPAEASSARPFVVATAAFLLFIQIASLIIGVPEAMRGRADFRQLYIAGYMVRSGKADKLFDDEANQTLQRRLVNDSVTRIYNHLPYETLFFLPFSFVGYRTAYVLFFCTNLILLWICHRLLATELAPLRVVWSWLPVSLFFCFLPVIITLIHGQDSIFVLLIFSWAAACLARGRDGASGAVTAIALFKFQLCLPIAVLFLLWRRWKFVGGFAVASAIFAVLSVAMVGMHAFRNYVTYLLAMTGSGQETPRAGSYSIPLHSMPDLRGLISWAGAWIASPLILDVLILLLSAFVVIWIAARNVPSYELAVAAAVLVGYHVLIHDATILLLPTSCLLLRGILGDSRLRDWKIPLAVSLIVLPTALLFAGGWHCLLAIPLLALCLLWQPVTPQTAEPAHNS